MKSFSSASLFSNTWAYFLLFGTTNAFLAFGSFSLATKIEISLVGLIIPFVWALAFFPASPQSNQPIYEKDYFQVIAWWVWALLGVLAVFIRFYRLTTFAVWPHYDEGLTSYYVLDLCRHWEWKLFFGNNQTPPLYLWGLGLVYKLFGPSLFSLWFFPALLSLLTVPLGYLAARQFFSKSFSLIAVFLLALGFWPNFIGRFSHMTVLVVLAECGVLALLGWCLQQPSPSLNKRLVCLGMGVGLGFYVYISWPVVAFMAGIAVLGIGASRKGLPEILKKFGFFLLVCLLMMSPLVWEAVRTHYGQDLKNLAAIGTMVSPWEQIQVSLSYLSSLFWGMDPNVHTYQPVWGGYLNPILGAFFFLGVLEMAQNRRKGIYQWLALAFIVFLFPGILTREVETFRVVPVLPVLLTITALGLARLLEPVSVKKNAWVLALIFLLSAGLDIYHLEKYHRLWDSMDNWKGYAKSYERYKAYGILEKISREEGPGLVFSDFFPGLCDQTLNLADYSFNAVENPAIPTEKAGWTALLTNVNYKPFLDKRFGPSRAFRISSEPAPSDGGWMLWVIHLTPANREVFEGWIKANQALKPFIEENLGHLYGQSYDKVLAGLKEAYSVYPPDPFLTSSYWEQTADVNLKQILFQDSKPGKEAWRQEVGLLSNAAAMGYPAAHLLFRSGIFLDRAGQKSEARHTFEEALRAPVDFTESRQYLDMLGKVEKGSLGK